MEDYRQEDGKVTTLSYTYNKRKSPVDYDFWGAPEGERLTSCHKLAHRECLPSGCGTATLSQSHLRSLRTLCIQIITELREMVPWGDGWTDNKVRGYATLPEHSKYKSVKDITSQGIVLHDADASLNPDNYVRELAVKKHRITAKRAFTKVHL